MKRNRAIATLSVAAALIVALGVGVAYLHTQNLGYRRAIEMANRRSFTQLTASLSAIDNSLEKLRYSYNGPAFTTTAAQAWRESEVAKFALASLPLSDARMEKVEKFIAQAGDYAFSMLRAAAGGATAGEEQMKAINSLSATARTLVDQMANLQARLDAEDVYIQINPKSMSMSGKAEGAAATDDFSKTEDEFPEYAKLIYDGPFSEHINSLKPKMLEGKSQVSREEAMEAAKAFLKTKSSLTPQQEGSGIIPYYSFSVGHTTLQVSKQGGVVIALCDNRELKPGKLNAQEALKKAAEFLVAQGYEQMKTSYYTVFENIVTVNFAHTEGDIIVYPDLIKVGIALDDGSVVRYDAAGYAMNHHARDIPTPALSRDQSWTDIPKNLEVVSKNTAIIPTSGKNEVLCYEFVCKNQEGSHVIVYINAQTGLQENLFLLIENENGVLTV